MNSVTTFDYAVPFDIMVGTWSGMTTSFTPAGEYQRSVPSRVFIFWTVQGTLMRYLQEELPDLDAILDKKHPHRAVFETIVSHDFDLRIIGKACIAEKNAEKVTLTGAETTPGNYLFHMHFPKFGHYYNNQYFINSNERHIIGPYLDNKSHEVAMIVSQTFVRLSYDVPEAIQRPAKGKG